MSDINIDINELHTCNGNSCHDKNCVSCHPLEYCHNHDHYFDEQVSCDTCPGINECKRWIIFTEEKKWQRSRLGIFEFE
ncbi:hypothetical protein HZB04_03015 [Candidatus Wolfebacteria bacterium]|nr:hypothetical protein [Candidatus Wolfebacteria bacterium]